MSLVVGGGGGPPPPRTPSSTEEDSDAGDCVVLGSPKRPRAGAEAGRRRGKRVARRPMVVELEDSEEEGEEGPGGPGDGDRRLALRLEAEEATTRAAQLAADLELAQRLQREEKARQAQCRFCSTVVVAGDDPRQAVYCEAEGCQEKGGNVCDRLLPCGHPCGGAPGEEECALCVRCVLPNEQCAVCFDSLLEDGVIRLGCGHVFHHRCIASALAEVATRGRRIKFNFLQCPLRCPGLISHPSLPEAGPLGDLHRRLAMDVFRRAQEDRLEPPADGVLEADDLLEKRYPFYVCYACGDHFCAGPACNAGEPEPEAVLCGSCRVGGQVKCPKHGADHLIHKCFYCCQPATFQCGGAAPRRFCDPCHAHGFNGPPKPCDPATCPLNGAHPANPCEHVVGCALCRGR